MYEAVRRLPIHQQIVAFILAVDRVVGDLPRERWYLRDQVRRAVLSILLNLREGAADLPAAEKARFYRMAKRSTAEVAAALEMLALFLPDFQPVVARLDQTAAQITLDLHKLAMEWTGRRQAATKGRGARKRTQRPLRP
jgi:four helix bundle protein